MIMKGLEFIHRRPMFIVGIVLGIAICGAVFFRGKKIVQNFDRRITRVESNSPCTDLTKSECAVKLLEALPETQRKRIKLSEETLRLLKLRARRERQNLRSSEVDPSPPSDTMDSAGSDSPGPSPGVLSPSPGSKGPGSSPAPTATPEPINTPEPEPEPTAEPAPTTRPIIKTPQIGPIHPIEVPCINVGDLIKC